MSRSVARHPLDPPPYATTARRRSWRSPPVWCWPPRWSYRLRRFPPTTRPTGRDRLRSVGRPARGWWHRATTPVIAGFSAAVANGDGTFWAMPDNDAGTQASSSDVLLRIHLIRPRWERAGGGTGGVQILRHLTLADPYRQIPYPIVREATPGRATSPAGDLDIESLQRMPDGSFWIGEELGPFLLHVDAAAASSTRPCRSRGGSPQNPDLDGEPAATQASGGIEAMAMSRNGRYLYPILEKALATEKDGRRRVISEFDTRRESLHRTHLGLPGRHRHQPGGRRPAGRIRARCSSSSATTSTVRRRSASACTGSTSTGTTAPACWRRPWSSIC